MVMLVYQRVMGGVWFFNSIVKPGSESKKKGAVQYSSVGTYRVVLF